MRSLNVIVMYLWKQYPWTIGWSPVDEIPGLGAEFTLVHLYSYYGMEPPPLIDGFHDRMGRCTSLMRDLHEEY